MTLNWCAGFGLQITDATSTPGGTWGTATGTPAFSGTWPAERLFFNYNGEKLATFRLKEVDGAGFQCVLVKDFSAQQWSGAGDGDDAYVLQMRSSDTTQALQLRIVNHDLATDDYTFKLVSTDAFGADDQTDEGSTHFAYGTDTPNLRITKDISGGTLTLEVDAGSGFAEECSITTSFDLNRLRPFAENFSDSSNAVGFGPTCLIDYDTASERVGIPDLGSLFPTDDATTVYSDYEPDEPGVDDWAGGGNRENNTGSAATYDEATGIANSATVRQTYDTDTYTVQNDEVRVAMYSWQKNTGASKSGTHYNVMADGTNLLETVGLTGIAGSFTLMDTIAQTAPGGGAWAGYASWAALEIGVRFTNGTDGSQNHQVDVVGCEIWDFPADPPPAGTRRIFIVG